MAATPTTSKDTKKRPSSPPKVLSNNTGLIFKPGKAKILRTKPTALYSSLERINLDTKDKKQIEDAIVTSIFKTPFSFIDTTGDSFGDVYDLQNHLNLVTLHFGKYDLQQVFIMQALGEGSFDMSGNFVDFDQSVDTRDLLTQWDSVTEKEVARNTEFLRQHCASPFLEANLSLTEEFLKNCMDSSLYNKCQESYKNYSVTERGGPLLFRVMLKHLLVNNESVSRTLVAKLEKLSLSSYEGQNVSSLVSHVRSIITRLTRMEEGSKTSTNSFRHLIPSDLPLKLIKLFAQADQPLFAKVFDLMQTQVFLDPSSIAGSTVAVECETILRKAEELYLTLVSSNEWNGVSDKVNETGFAARALKVSAALLGRHCWNCGEEGHRHNKCTHPINNDVIEQNRRRHQQSKNDRSSSTTSSSKNPKNKIGRRNDSNPLFQPPGRNESNWREIRGKWHYFHFKSKTWKVANRGPPPSVADTKTSAQPAITASKSSKSSGSSPVDAALANLSRALSQAMDGM